MLVMSLPPVEEVVPCTAREVRGAEYDTCERDEAEDGCDVCEDGDHLLAPGEEDVRGSTECEGANAREDEEGDH